MERYSPDKARDEATEMEKIAEKKGVDYAEAEKILENEKLDVISRPEISITKLARNNPLGFKIKTALLPEIKLPKYKEISKKTISEITAAEKNIEVTEKEIEDTIMDIRKSRAHKVHMAESVPHEHKEGEEHDHSHEPARPADASHAGGESSSRGISSKAEEIPRPPAGGSG